MAEQKKEENVLNKIQTELKAPKGQRNTFGNYNYRSAEDILDALKPLLEKYEATATLSDDLIMIGDRYYIRATATLTAGEATYHTTAYAREEESKKGMDGAQITGAASSYARKYALNGLFAIDDTKDSDSTNKHGKDEEEANDAFYEEVKNIQTVKGLESYYKKNKDKYPAKTFNKAVKERKDALTNKNDEDPQGDTTA